MSPMQSVKLTIWEWLVARGRRQLPAGRTAWRALLVLGLASGLRVAAQEPDAPPALDETMTAEVLGQISNLVQAADSAQPEDMAPTNNLSQANAPAPNTDRAAGVNRFDNSRRSESANRFQSPGQSQNDDRRSRGRRSFRSRSDRSGPPGSANDSGVSSDRTQTNTLAGPTNSPVSLDYAAFKIIADRNIFDPNRFPHRPGVPTIRKPNRVDSLTLVGIMSYEKGTFAFFDGTSSEYKKALKLTDAIAGYKVTNIAPNGVKLASGTNELELTVGTQLRREEDGPWLLAGQGGSYAATPASTSTNTAAATATGGSDAASSGAESDTLKKMMERRAKE